MGKRCEMEFDFLQKTNLKCNGERGSFIQFCFVFNTGIHQFQVPANNMKAKPGALNIYNV